MRNTLLFSGLFFAIFTFLVGLGALFSPKEPDVISSIVPCHEVRSSDSGSHADSVASR